MPSHGGWVANANHYERRDMYEVKVIHKGRPMRTHYRRTPGAARVLAERLADYHEGRNPVAIKRPDGTVSVLFKAVRYYA